MTNVKVNNLPEYAARYEFVVARLVDDELWFYGAYGDGFKAEQVASEVYGIVIHTPRP